MRNRRRNVSTGTAKSVSGQLLALSLFIMLLAFFIVLNAISAYEQTKVTPVMQSLSMAFASGFVEPQDDQSPSVTEDDDPSIDEGDTLERIEALFSSQIPGYKASLSHRKGLIYVQVPFDDFESSVMAVGQRNALNQSNDKTKFLKGFFLPTLVSLMKNDDMNMTYRMDMIVNISENPAELQNQRPKELAALVRKLSNISKKLEAAGLSTKLISAGIQEGEAGTIELLFKPHVPFNPLGNEEYE